MRRSYASLVSFLAVGLTIAACVDVPSAPVTPTATSANLVAGTCTTVGEINGLARAVFRTASPNVNSVLGKIKSLDQDVKKGNLSSAVSRAHDIVDFTLEHHHAGRLPGTDAELTAFVNAVYCFAGIDVDIDEPSNSHLIFPSDQPQIVYSIDNQAAIRFDANPVSEPTLIEFVQLSETYPPGGGPLDTKLDQYPGFITVTKSSETNAPLTKPAELGVCASGVIPTEVRERLRLGHGKASGFEIAAPAVADFLDCENLTGEEEEVADAGVFTKLARLLMPKELHARSAMYFRGGGIGGTVTEFSPFAPVDPELRSGGGIGGTVTEFIRSPMLGALLLSDALEPMESCTAITATTGTKVPVHCRPFVRITTRLGTLMSEVPVTWAATTGDGLVAGVEAGECGSFAPVIVSATDLFGQSAACWKLGAVGLNQLTATPGVGGDAPTGVTFVPVSVTFDADATPLLLGPPTLIEKVQGDGQSGPAEQPTAVAPKVRVLDAAGNPVPGVQVTWLVLSGSGTVSASTVITDALGRAQVAWTLGSGYNRIKAYIDQVVFAYVYFEATGTVAP